MRPAERAGHLQRGVVEVGERTVLGEFQHGVGVEAREGGQFANLALCPLAVAGVARDQQRALGTPALVEDAGGGGFEVEPVPVTMPETQLRVAALAKELGLVQRLAQHLRILGVNPFLAARARELRQIMAEHELERRADVEQFATRIEQADQVAGVLRDEPVLLLAATQGDLGRSALSLGLFLEQSLADRLRKTAQAGLEDVILRARLETFDRNLLRVRASHQDQRDVHVLLAQKFQGLQRAELGKIVVGEDDLRRQARDLTQEILAVLDPPGFMRKVGAAQFTGDQLGVIRHVFDKKDVQGAIHVFTSAEARPAGKARRASVGVGAGCS